MTISALLFLSGKGDVVLSRSYRDGLNIRTIGDAFRTEIISTKLVDRFPIKTIGNITFLHTRYENIYVVAAVTSNANAALVFQFLKNVWQLLTAYFGTITDEVIREHFVTIQELLDEAADFGYPQLTEPDVLKSFITTTGINPAVLTKGKAAEQITIQATGNINWRRNDIVHRKNEVFIDIIEDVNLLVSQSGQVLHRDVSGKIVMKSFLSGMPDCKFGLNDKMMMEAEDKAGKPGKKSAEIDLEDVTFHQCVRLGKFDADRTISFIPPDGEFVLMKFRTAENVSPPFRVLTPMVKETGKTRIEIEFKVKADFASRLFGTNVVIKVPCPKNTANVKVNVSAGKAKYEPEHQGIMWRIRKFPGQSECRFAAEVQLISTTSDGKVWSRPPISMQFQVPMFAASGLNVRFLKVHEPKMNYQTVKWVRYMSRAGQYECRL